jgi:isopentenyl diphosphate isomerase/L-lactate dehydrogenase-like FMN-dependent dehydrogenase
MAASGAASDIVKAICLGARAVLVGRAYAWALGAAGGPGVDRAIDILRSGRRQDHAAAGMRVGRRRSIARTSTRRAEWLC